MTDLPLSNQRVLVKSRRVTRGLTVRQEAFAQRYASHGNAAKAYREAFHVGRDSQPVTVRRMGYELVHRPDVRERVRQLSAIAAEGTTISARARMVWLQSIIEADVREVMQVTVAPCLQCWPTQGAGVAALPTSVAGQATAPREDCPACGGRGVSRVHVTPSEQWSASARALVRSIRQKANGEIEVRLHSQLEASDQLNRMSGCYIDRSIVAHVTVKPLPANLSIEEAMRLLESIAPAPSDV